MDKSKGKGKGNETEIVFYLTSYLGTFTSILGTAVCAFNYIFLGHIIFVISDALWIYHYSYCVKLNSGNKAHFYLILVFTLLHITYFIRQVL